MLWKVRKRKKSDFLEMCGVNIKQLTSQQFLVIIQEMQYFI